MTADMLKFLTKKLKSQSLSEGQTEFDPEVKIIIFFEIFMFLMSFTFYLELSKNV